MTKNQFTPLEKETVLWEAKVGKRIAGIYVVIGILLGFDGIGSLLGGIFAYEEVPNAWWLIVTGIALIIVVLLLIGHYISTKNRRYILTDKRIVIMRGGKIKRSNRSLALKSIHGAEKNNNFLYDLFGIATVDFYAMAAASTTTKLKIFSFSSTDFKFQWVDRSDADRVYALMQTYLVEGDFERRSDSAEKAMKSE